MEGSDSNGGLWNPLGNRARGGQVFGEISQKHYCRPRRDSHYPGGCNCGRDRLHGGFQGSGGCFHGTSHGHSDVRSIRVRVWPLSCNIRSADRALELAQIKSRDGGSDEVQTRTLGRHRVRDHTYGRRHRRRHGGSDTANVACQRWRDFASRGESSHMAGVYRRFNGVPSQRGILGLFLWSGQGVQGQRKDQESNCLSV